jgi:ubiquinone/menaquinone biosynthesis C-methylase UbiE
MICRTSPPRLGGAAQSEAGRRIRVGRDQQSIAREEPDTDTYMHQLAVTAPLMKTPVRSAIQALRPPSGSRGLDVGCGIGLHVPLLSEAVGPNGHVTGLDLRPEFLVRAREIASGAGLSQRVDFRTGDFRRLPFDDDTFDWAWSANAVGYAPGETVLSFKELARVVKPGGTVAILIWSSEQLLPGYPLLEARLRATSSGIAPFTRGTKPGLHFLRGLGSLREAGLKEPAAETFAGTAHAPLSDEMRQALTSLIEMRWPDVKSELTPEDWLEYQRLCQPDSPDFILNLPDYYAFFTYSLFHGKVAE